MNSRLYSSGLRPSRFLFIAGLLLIAWSGRLRAEPVTGAYADLADRLDRKIAEFDWAGGQIGVMVADFRHGITAYTRDPDIALRPGPVTKLVTAAAAIDRLGPDFTFSTELFVRGDVTKGRLMGDLMIRGDGDPSLTSLAGTDRAIITKFLDRWASALKKEKITRIEGSIWVDASAFDAIPYAAGWPVDRMVDPEVPEISALNLNDNCVELFWKPGKKKKQIAEFDLFPPVQDYVYFSNNVRIEEGTTVPRQFFRRQEYTTIAVEGRLDRGVTAHDRVTVPNPPLFFGHAVKTRLADSGIELVGAVSNWRDADLAVQESRRLRRIDVHQSPPLRHIVPVMLGQNRTLDAEVLFKTLGRRATGEPGSFENGSGALTDTLDKWGVPTSGVVFLDGSGLSSFNRISARNLLGVLEAIHRAPWLKAFEPAVPRISLEHARSSVAPQKGAPPLSPELAVYGLSGSFPDGFSAAGWAETRGHSRLHFAILVEGSRVPPSLIRAQVEVLMREIADSAIP